MIPPPCGAFWDITRKYWDILGTRFKVIRCKLTLHLSAANFKT